MMLIPVFPDRSSIHGLGLFTTGPVPAGTPIWRFLVGFDRWLEEGQVAAFPEAARQYVQHFGSFDSNRKQWLLNGDLAVMMNHSATPNTGAPGVTGTSLRTFALRDIAAGEELTCDYAAFDAAPKPVA